MLAEIAFADAELVFTASHREVKALDANIDCLYGCVKALFGVTKFLMDNL